MSIVDYIAIAAIVLIVSAALFYIVRAKRNGAKCVGCSYAKQCGGKCGCGGTNADEQNGSK